MRIALFFTTLALGGAERQALHLLQHADRKKFDLHVYAIQGGALEAQLKQLRIPCRILNTKSAVHSIRTVRAWIKEDHIDVLHCLLWHTNIIGRFACAGTRTRCINSIRWAEWQARDIIDFSTRFLVDQWIANSEHGAAIARLPKHKTIVIQNGLSKELLQTPLSAWKPRSKTALMVGNFRREKRYDLVLATATSHPDWQFNLIGDGPLRKTVQAQARALKNVHFLGTRNDVAAQMLKSNAVLLLSTSEGTPNVVLEAMALGVPVVGSAIPAHTTLLKGRGWIVENTPADVGKALEDLASVPKKELGAKRAAAQAYVRKTYALPRMVRETESAWKLP